MSGSPHAARALAAILAAAAAPDATAAPDAAAIRAVLGEAKGEASADWDLYALRLGVSPSADRDLFIADPALPRRIEIAFAMWVARAGERVVVIDAGFSDRAPTERWKMTDVRTSTEALAAIGLTPEQITDVVITHRHWDHIGGLPALGGAGATVWISAAELRALRDEPNGPNESNGTDRRILDALATAERQGRLRVTTGVTRVAPSLVVVPVGLHTAGFQYVAAATPEGPWVIASDIGPLRASFTRLASTGQTSDRKQTRAVLETMLALTGGDLTRIVPGHEPSLFERGPDAHLRRASR